MGSRMTPTLFYIFFFLSPCRHEFDSEQIPDLSRDVFRQDIHSVGSLCKLYFRELPNPLLTYQLYDRFSVRTLWLWWIWEWKLVKQLSVVRRKGCRGQISSYCHTQTTGETMLKFQLIFKCCSKWGHCIMLSFLGTAGDVHAKTE